MMLPGTVMAQGRVLPGVSFVDPGSGSAVNVWGFRQRAGLVLAFLHERCTACRAFAENLATVKEDMDWAEARVQAVLSQVEELSIPVLLDPGRNGTQRLLGENAELPVVLVMDRYGAAWSSFPAPGHRFPMAKEVASTVGHAALQCPECGVSHCPTWKRNQPADEGHRTAGLRGPSPDDSLRVLVDRLWPRGMSKQRPRLDRWAREIAPSPALRRWYGHRPERFPEFARLYRDELGQEEARAELEALLEAAGRTTLTLLTATRDVKRSAAAVVADTLRADPSS